MWYRIRRHRRGGDCSGLSVLLGVGCRQRTLDQCRLVDRRGGKADTPMVRRLSEQFETSRPPRPAVDPAAGENPPPRLSLKEQHLPALRHSATPTKARPLARAPSATSSWPSARVCTKSSSVPAPSPCRAGSRPSASRSRTLNASGTCPSYSLPRRTRPTTS